MGKIASNSNTPAIFGRGQQQRLLVRALHHITAAARIEVTV
jgi:hypothetical protein